MTGNTSWKVSWCAVAWLLVGCGDGSELLLAGEEAGADDGFAVDQGLSASLPLGTVLQTTDALNLRPEPSTLKPRLGLLPRGAKVTLLASAPVNAFYRVRSALGQEGFAHGAYLVEVQAPPPPPPARGGFVAANYTDVGNSLDLNQVRQDARRVFDAYRAAGVTEVRVWAFPPYGPLGDNLSVAAERVNLLLEEAGARGMTLTVDMLDYHSGGPTSFEEQWRKLVNAEDRARTVVQAVVGRAGRHSNVYWSPGNEPAAPGNPTEFAQWFARQAQLIRKVAAAAGNPSARVSAELVPGACNHPFVGGAPKACAASVAAVADRVGIHLYPEGTPDQWASSYEMRSYAEWRSLAQKAGKSFFIGEFGVHESRRSDGLLDAWLQRFFADGVDGVSFWQLNHVRYGHIDPWTTFDFDAAARNARFRR